MSQPLASGHPAPPAPRFYVTPNQRLSPGAFLLALLVAAVCLCAVLYALGHTFRGRAFAGAAGILHTGASDDDDSDQDDPSKVDTIYLGGPAEAPVATRPHGHPSTVHPFVVIHLPRSGSGTGQIPDTAAGRVLYAWMAAFNGTDPSALQEALPAPEAGLLEAAQVELRRQTGGFTLVSAREVQPGLLVFRLHDQTASETEALGTLQVRPGDVPATIVSFQLRAVQASQGTGH